MKLRQLLIGVPLVGKTPYLSNPNTAYHPRITWLASAVRLQHHKGFPVITLTTTHDYSITRAFQSSLSRLQHHQGFPVIILMITTSPRLSSHHSYDCNIPKASQSSLSRTTASPRLPSHHSHDYSITKAF